METFLFSVDEFSCVVGEGSLDRADEAHKRASRGVQYIPKIGSQHVRMESRDLRASKDALRRWILQGRNDFSKRLSLQVKFTVDGLLVVCSSYQLNLALQHSVFERKCGIRTYTRMATSVSQFCTLQSTILNLASSLPSDGTQRKMSEQSYCP